MALGLFDLTGKVALVTGGNGGIGLGMAKGLAMHGATVVIWGNKPDKNERAVAELDAFGGIVRCAQVDVADEAAVKAGIAAILEEFGRLDQAIANAGIGIARRDMFEISQADFDKLQSINVYGVFYTLREAAAHMIERGKAGERGGSLVSIASTAAVHGAARNEHQGCGAVADARYGGRTRPARHPRQQHPAGLDAVGHDRAVAGVGQVQRQCDQPRAGRPLG